jgi:hypothetical protein
VPLLAPRSRAASKPALHLNTRLVSPAPVGVDKSLSKSEISARASLSARLAYGRSDTERLQSTHSAATRHASLGDLHTSCGLSAEPYAIPSVAFRFGVLRLSLLRCATLRFARRLAQPLPAASQARRAQAGRTAWQR